MSEIGSEAWLRERFPEKDWHRHLRTDGGFDLCDGTPSDCTGRPRPQPTFKVYTDPELWPDDQGPECKICGVDLVDHTPRSTHQVLSS